MCLVDRWGQCGLELGSREVATSIYVCFQPKHGVLPHQRSRHALFVRDHIERGAGRSPE